jgi:hypothetical protein
MRYDTTRALIRSLFVQTARVAHFFRLGISFCSLYRPYLAAWRSPGSLRVLARSEGIPFFRQLTCTPLQIDKGRPRRLYCIVSRHCSTKRWGPSIAPAKFMIGTIPWNHFSEHACFSTKNIPSAVIDKSSFRHLYVHSLRAPRRGGAGLVQSVWHDSILAVVRAQ